MNVVWTGDLKPYRERKVRLLNGAHTAIALPAFLAGIDTVRETIEDPLFARYLHALLFDDIAPHVPLPDHERRAYAETVARTLRQSVPPARAHLHRAQFRVEMARAHPADREGRGRRGPRRAAESRLFAGGLVPVLSRAAQEGGAYFGARERGDYPLRDDPTALATFASIWAEADPTARPAPPRACCARRCSGERTCRRSPVSNPRRGRRRRRSKGSAFAARSRSGSRKRRQAGREPDFDVCARRPCLPRVS